MARRKGEVGNEGEFSWGLQSDGQWTATDGTTRSPSPKGGFTVGGCTEAGVVA